MHLQMAADRSLVVLVYTNANVAPNLGWEAKKSEAAPLRGKVVGGSDGLILKGGQYDCKVRYVRNAWLCVALKNNIFLPWLLVWRGGAV